MDQLLLATSWLKLVDGKLQPLRSKLCSCLNGYKLLLCRPFCVPHQMAASAVNLLHFSISKAIPVPSPRYTRPRFRLSFSPLAAATDLFDRAEQGVVDPGLRPSEVIFSNSVYHAQIVVDEAESEEALVRRFRREVSKAGVIQEFKRRRFFENKQEEKKRKAREAGRRNRRRRSGARFPSSPFSADDDVVPQPARDDDNWDLPEGDIPY